MNAALDTLALGFDDPVLDSQATFRAALEAMAHPGRVVALPVAKTSGHPLLAPATASLLLTLLDSETAVGLVGSLCNEPLRAWLRFHTGTREAVAAEAAAFTVVRAAELTPMLWTALALGSDERPQDGATLIVEVPWFGVEPAASKVHRLTLSGPGIDGSRTVTVAGVPVEFWRHRIELQPLFPRGFDLLLVHARSVIGLPRTTRIALEP